MAPGGRSIVWLVAWSVGLVVVVGLWGMSYYRSDRLMRSTTRDSFWIAASVKGRLIVQVVVPAVPAPADAPVRWRTDSGPAIEPGPFFRRGWESAGFGWTSTVVTPSYATARAATPRAPMTYRTLGVPLWAPTSVCLVALGWGAYRRRMAPGPGLCPACGYDLRATPERCPECGRAAG